MAHKREAGPSSSSPTEDSQRPAAKRAKVAPPSPALAASPGDGGYELLLGGERFVDVDRLFKCARLAAHFNKTYKRSAKRLIQDEYLDVVVVSKKHAALGLLCAKTTYSPRADVRVVRLTNDVVRLIARASGDTPPLAPPVIKDADLSFFVDQAGTEHSVEMRGERTMERILFKAKDVGAVFASERFADTLRDARCAYQEHVDYVCLTVSNQNEPLAIEDTSTPAKSQVRRTAAPTKPHHTRELFLTFAGLMHALHSTRSPVANEFRTWIYTQVFAIAYGTADQKKAMVNELCRVDKRFLEAFMKLVPNDIACLYLLDTNQREQGKRVLKFGRSGNVKDRFYKHSATFGDDCLLDTIVFVPGDALSAAETRLNHMIADAFRFEAGTARELLLLDASAYRAVRACMQTIADKYNGSLAVHSLILDGEVKDVQTAMREQQLRYELRVNDLERMLQVVDERARAELSSERVKVAVLEEQLAAARQQLEAGRIQLEQQRETAALRLQVQQLQHNAAIAEMERRIAALELKTRQRDVDMGEPTDPRAPPP